MKIKIKDKDLELHYSMRMYILYENITGKSLSFENMSSYTSLIVLFYSAIVATIQRNHINMTISYDEFMDWLDEQNGATIMKDFSDWFTSCLTNNISLQDDTVEEDNKKDKGKKSKN